MNLTWWNQRTFDEVMEVFKTDRRAAVVQATGTGKSTIIKAVEEAIPGRKLLLAPQANINDQFAEHGLPDGVETMTYFMLMSKVKRGDIEDLKGFSLIVADELHRTGADQWGKAFDYVANTLNPEAKLLGATATPKRTDQKEKDMIDILFGGNRCGNISLKQAIQRSILPTPVYVASMYSLDEEISKEISKLETSSLSDREKDDIIDSLDKINVNWDQIKSITTTFNEFLLPLVAAKNKGKVLVFAKNINHIKRIRKTLDPIFEDIFQGYTVNISEYHSQTDDSAFTAIKKTLPDKTVNILYTVNKFNEGVHINDLDTVILLRDTKSEIIYYQQIGRVLSMGNQDPLIIDLVNNFRSVKQCMIWRELEEEREFSGEHHEKDEHKVIFYNYVEDVAKIFDEIDKKIDIEYSVNGKTGSIPYLCAVFNKNLAEVYQYMKEGKTFEEAFEAAREVKHTKTVQERMYTIYCNYLVYLFKSKKYFGKYIGSQLRSKAIRNEISHMIWDDLKDRSRGENALERRKNSFKDKLYRICGDDFHTVWENISCPMMVHLDYEILSRNLQNYNFEKIKLHDTIEYEKFGDLFKKYVNSDKSLRKCITSMKAKDFEDVFYNTLLKDFKMTHLYAKSRCRVPKNMVIKTGIISDMAHILFDAHLKKLEIHDDATSSEAFIEIFRDSKIAKAVYKDCQ